MPTAFSNFFKKNNQSNSKGPEPEVKKLQKETPKKKAKKQEGTDGLFLLFFILC